MERQPFGDPFQRVIERNGLMSPQVMLEEGVQCCTPKWYFSKKEIEEQSPSRKDGISFKKETVLRSLYCSFLQDLGMKLKVPQVTIATAMMFCHRFYLRQSHATNEWQTIGTVSMFLACKVEETPRLLKDVVFVAYETMHKRDPSAAQRIKQKDVFEKQKELLVTGERVLLATVGFDFNIQHPYKPLVAALKKLDISHNDLAKVAWNFVNDWLRTTLCLQYKPHYVAAGSLYLAAKFHKVKLPSEKEKVWWLEFDVTPQRLEEVIQQMLTLLEQSKNPLMLLSRERVTQATVSKRAPSDSPQSCVVNGLNKTGDSGKRVEKLGGDGRLHKLRQNTSSDDVRAAKKEEISECDKKKPYLHNRQNIPNEDIRVPKKEEVSGPLTSFSHEKVTQAALVKKTQFGSPKSGLLNGLHPCSNSRNRGDEKAAEINAPIVDICVARKESQSQTSDSGSAHSVVEDGDRFDEGEVQVKVVAESKEIASNVIASDDAELNKSEAVNRCNEGEVHTKEAVESNENAIRDVSSDAGLNKIDKDRIREALKKRKYDRIANKKTVKSTHEDGDDDSWIVRELEDGIELQSSSAEKKQRL